MTRPPPQMSASTYAGRETDVGFWGRYQAEWSLCCPLSFGRWSGKCIDTVQSPPYSPWRTWGPVKSGSVPEDRVLIGRIQCLAVTFSIQVRNKPLMFLQEKIAFRQLSPWTWSQVKSCMVWSHRQRLHDTCLIQCLSNVLHELACFIILEFILIGMGPLGPVFLWWFHKFGTCCSQSRCLTASSLVSIEKIRRIYCMKTRSAGNLTTDDHFRQSREMSK